MNRKEELKSKILELTREYYKEVHGQKKEFVPGKTFVNLEVATLMMKKW